MVEHHNNCGQGLWMKAKISGQKLEEKLVSKNLPPLIFVNNKGKKITLQWRNLADNILTKPARLTSPVKRCTDSTYS